MEFLASLLSGGKQNVQQRQNRDSLTGNAFALCCTIFSICYHVVLCSEMCFRGQMGFIRLDWTFSADPGPNKGRTNS